MPDVRSAHKDKRKDKHTSYPPTAEFGVNRDVLRARKLLAIRR